MRKTKLRGTGGGKPEDAGVALVPLRSALSEVQLGEKTGTANQKWQWTKEGFLESFVGRFLQCESAVEDDDNAPPSSVFAEMTTHNQERWRYTDTEWIEHIWSGLVLDAHACGKWTQDPDGSWREEFDGMSVGLAPKDLNRVSQRWVRRDEFLINKENNLVLEINNSQVDVDCFDLDGFKQFREFVSEGGDVDGEGNFLRRKGGPPRVTRMWQAAYSGNLHLLEELHAMGANLNHIGGHRLNALSVVTSATSASHLQAARFLLNVGKCDPFLTGKGGVWEGVSPFAASIVNMPQFALNALERKACHVRRDGQSDEWKYDFAGVELNESRDSLVEVRTACGQPFVQPLELMVEHARQDLLMTPVMQKVLEARWEAFGSRKFNAMCLVNAVYAALFICTIFVWPWQPKAEDGTPKLAIVLASCLFVFTFFQVASHRSQLQGSFLVDLYTLVTMAVEVCVPVSLLLVGTLPDVIGLPEIATMLCVVLCVVLPINLMRLAILLRRTGPFLIGLQWVLWDVLRVIAFFALPFAGFALALFVVNSHDPILADNDSTDTMQLPFPLSFLSVPLDDEYSFVLYEVINAVFGVALLVMVAVLIAVVSNTFNFVQDVSMGEWVTVRANFLLQLPTSTRQLSQYMVVLKDMEMQTFTDNSALAKETVTLELMASQIAELTTVVRNLEQRRRQ